MEEQKVNLKDWALCVDCGRTVVKDTTNFFIFRGKKRYLCRFCKEEREVLFNQMDIGEFQEWQGV